MKLKIHRPIIFFNFFISYNEKHDRKRYRIFYNGHIRDLNRLIDEWDNSKPLRMTSNFNKDYIKRRFIEKPMESG